MAEQTEQKNNDLTALRQNLVSEYTQKEGLSEKEASEKADAYLREHIFRPNAAEIDPQIAGLQERAAEAARQQAAEKELAEQEAPAPAAKTQKAKDAPAPAAKTEAAKEGEDVPVFSAGDEFTPDVENHQESEESLEDLEAQLLRTAWKNKYMHFENDEENKDKDDKKKHLCPFLQCLPDTISKNTNPLSVSMQLENGTTVTNSPKRVHMDYKNANPSFEDCLTMVRIGMEKGWKSAKLEGSEEYKKQMYLAMRAMGMKVIGYTPSPEVEKEATDYIAKHTPDRDKAEAMDKRYPALDKARGDIPFHKVDAEKFADIRKQAESDNSVSSEMKGIAAEMAQESGVSNSLFSKDLKNLDSANKAQSDAAMDKFLTQGTFKKILKGYDKLPDEKKTELAGKLEKLVGNLVENHPKIATKLAYDLSSNNKGNGKGPAKMLQAYGTALNRVKEAEAKGLVTTNGQTKLKNPQKVQSSIMNATKRLSGIER